MEQNLKTPGISVFHSMDEHFMPFQLLVEDLSAVCHIFTHVNSHMFPVRKATIWSHSLYVAKKKKDQLLMLKTEPENTKCSRFLAFLLINAE